MTTLTRLAISVLCAAALIGGLTSCKRLASNSRTEQSAVPAAGSVSPAQCSIPFDGDFVEDTAGVLNDDARNKLEQKLDTLKSAGKVDFSVVTVSTIKDQEIADYSLALARCWSIGETNPDGAGMLLMLAVDDRRWHLQISRRMEKVLSNEEIQEAGSQMTPHLRERNYPEGIDRFVDATIKTIAARRNFSMPAAEQ
jgi:uncharacterized protein